MVQPLCSLLGLSWVLGIVFHRGADIIYLLLYVDDIIITASSTTLL
jgi:hypothetical protein